MMSVKCDSFFNHLKNFKCNTCNFISDYAVFSKAVDVFYSTLRARITSKEDHQVLVDRVMNLGCKRIKLGGRRFVCKIEMIFSSKSCQDFAED